MHPENRMSVRRALIPLALALLAAGCADERHPTGVPQPFAPAPHFLRWASPLSPQFSAVGAVSSPGADGVLQASLSDGLSLDRHVATFWAVRGQERSIQINYLSATGDTSSPFLQLTIADPTYEPGRGDLAPGDSVLITVTIDTVNIGVSLEPTGLQFGDPAQLRISYGGAGGDLNGDGVVDETDAHIETQLLGMWYREGADSAWTRISASQSLPDKSFISELLHFCEFEVSFSEYAVSW
jgi:hypothetical protein